MHIFVALSLSHALDKLTYEGKRGLSQNRFHFEAIVYCTHKGASDIVKSLLKTGLLVIQVTKQIIYRHAMRSLNGANNVAYRFCCFSSGDPCVYDINPASVTVELCREKN